MVSATGQARFGPGANSRLVIMIRAGMSLIASVYLLITEAIGRSRTPFRCSLGASILTKRGRLLVRLQISGRDLITIRRI